MFEDDFLQDEMGLGLRVSSTGGGSEPGMSFLEFESLYTMEKELMQSRQDVGQVDDKCIFGGWFGRRGLYTELPDPLCQQAIAAAAAAASSQIPTEGFSFAPGWSLNVEHFFQWQHRNRTTQQVFLSRIVFRIGHGTVVRFKYQNCGGRNCIVVTASRLDVCRWFLEM